jgi:hypothetical protein
MTEQTEQNEFHFVEIKGEPALDMQESARYIQRSYATLRNLLIRYPHIKRYRTGVGNKNFLIKKDLDWLLEHAEARVPGLPEEREFHFVNIQGRQALSLLDASGYMGITQSGLQKKLKNHPEIKSVRFGADTRKRYLFKEDLDQLMGVQEDE